MKGVCDGILKIAKSGNPVAPELLVVTRNFIRLQEQRHKADYDNSKSWSRDETLVELKLASDAFDAWRTLRAQDAAQDFLLDLFLPKRVIR
ncbi:MAG TPA: hypothetical protein VGL53_11975 [Bryobacteraceae bacterium]|jgi:hypothetical protein